MRLTFIIFLLFIAAAATAQTVVIDTNYTTTVLECVSDYVAFPDGTRYFSGLVVKQGTREYYLNSQYKVEVLGTSLVFDDFDTYTDKVTVSLGRTAYADMDTFQNAAVACLSAGTSGPPGAGSVIDSISYYGDTLYVYTNGDPVPFTTYIDSCPCEEPPLPAECVLVLGDPATGEVVGDPATGQVIFVASCADFPLSMAKENPQTRVVYEKNIDSDIGVNATLPCRPGRIRYGNGR